MKTTEESKKFKGMNSEELSKELLELQKKLSLASLNVAAGKLENYSEISKLKKSVARAVTVIREKELAND